MLRHIFWNKWQPHASLQQARLALHGKHFLYDTQEAKVRSDFSCGIFSCCAIKSRLISCCFPPLLHAPPPRTMKAFCLKRHFSSLLFSTCFLTSFFLQNSWLLWLAAEAPAREEMQTGSLGHMPKGKLLLQTGTWLGKKALHKHFLPH